MLRTVAYAFQQEKVAADAQAIAQLGRELYDRIGTLLNHINEVSRCIDPLVNAQGEVVGSLERRVLPSTRKLSELGVTGPDEKLPEMSRVTATARQVQAPELLTAGELREPSTRPSAEEAA